MARRNRVIFVYECAVEETCKRCGKKVREHFFRIGKEENVVCLDCLMEFLKKILRFVDNE